MDCFYKVANNCVDFVRLIVICIMRCPLNHDEWKTGALLPSLGMFLPLRWQFPI